MKTKPMLGDFALDGIEYIESSESRALAEHRVPGLAGNYFQDMGSVANTIVIAGTKSGDEARDAFLESIRKIFNKGEQTTFVADINTATDITDVIIEDLDVAEVGGSAHSFRYQLKLRKYTKPPEPPPTSLLDTGILGDALNVVDALNALDALSSIPNLGDPTGPIRGALDNLKGTTGGLDQAVGSIRNLVSQDVPGPTAPPTPAPTPAPGAEGGPAPTPGTETGTSATPTPVPRVDPADPRIDSTTGPALQQMLDGPNPSPAAASLVNSVQNGSVAGITGPDSDMAKQLAAAHGKQPNELVPTGHDSAVVLDPTSPLQSPPTVILRDGVAQDPARLAPALEDANRTLDLFQRGAVGPCDGNPSATPVANLVPASFCQLAVADTAAPVTSTAPGITADEFDQLELVEEPPTEGEIDEPAKDDKKCTVGIEVGFVHFNIDRDVLMPEGPTPDPGTDPPGGGIDGLQLVASALDHAAKHPLRKMLLTGHSDSTAIIQYNLPLSARRADSTFFVLQGYIHKAEWVQSGIRDGGHADDWRRILRWVDKQFSLDCEASDPLKPDFAKDQKAINNFQKGYNNEVDKLKASGTNQFAPGFAEKIPGSQLGFVGIATWQAFFDFYQRDLMRQLNLSTQAELTAIQDKVSLITPPTQGCGEFHSRDLTERAARREAGYPEKVGPKEPRDRRVEIIFFDPDEAPPFECHPTLTDRTKCEPLKCELYKDQQFVQRSLPVLGATASQLTIQLEGMEVRAHGDAQFEPGRSFNPLVRGRIKFIVSVAGLSTPFEGKVRLTLSRNTTDGLSPVAVVEEEFCSTGTDATVEVIWTGRVDREVPRQVSNRTTPNLNKGQGPTNIPLREMAEGGLVLHGLYVVQQIELLEKDDTVVSSVTPTDGGFVVPMVCTLFFNTFPFGSGLNRFGIGNDTQTPLPYIEDIRRAIFLIARSYYTGIGIQFFFTHEKKTAAGLAAELKDSVFSFGQSGPGGTKLDETGEGFDLNINIFGWSDSTFDKRENKEEFFCQIGPEALLDRNADQSSDDSKVLNEVFGPLGVHPKAVSTPVSDTQRPQPTRPRTMTNGKVDGRITVTDFNNTSSSINNDGVFTVATSNPAIVPTQRAAEIERALNALTNVTGMLVAHELGHALGLIAQPSPQKAVIAVEDKGTFLSPLAGTFESHNAIPVGELMDDGNAIRLRKIFTPGTRLPLSNSNRRYLTDCFPESP